MDPNGLVKWAREVPDREKRAMATRISAVRESTNERYLYEARAGAQWAAEGEGVFDYFSKLSATAVPEDWEDRDMDEWTVTVSGPLRSALHDALIAIVADGAIGKGHRRVLAAPLLPEIPELAASLEL
jgi:hypothetical protein